LERVYEIFDRSVKICRKPERVITVERGLDGVTVHELILEEQGVNEHLLMNPKFTCFQVPLELDTKKNAEWSQVFDPKGLLDLALDKCQERH